MISVYKIFQIIFGLIFSILILFFLIQYAQNYAGFAETKNEVTIMDNFRHTARDVFFSGNPVVFDDTDQYDFSSCRIEYSPPNDPQIKCSFGEVAPVLVPVLFSLRNKEKSVVWRSSIDYGWWKEDFSAALPETTIIFTPEDVSEETWNLMEDIVSSFPSTSNFDVKIAFGLCDGDSLVGMCGGNKCEKDAFLPFIDILRNSPISAEKCTVPLNDRQVLVTISHSCSPGYVGNGICIKPQSGYRGFGYIYTSRPDDTYVYKDTADILSLIIGGEKEDPFGKTGAERLYEYKNSFFTKKLSLAARIMQNRATVLKSEYQERCDPIVSPRSTYCVCHPLYNTLESTLSDVQSKIVEGCTSFSCMDNLKTSLDEAQDAYDKLVEKGCET